MKPLKTYNNVNKEKEDIHFGISKMEEIFTKRNGEKDEPHRHNYYTILIVNKAKGQHKIDFNSYQLDTHQIFFVAPGQVHQVIEDEMSYGFSLVFSNQFLVENAISMSFIDNLNLFNNYDQSPPLEPNEAQFNAIEHFANEIYKLYHSEAPMKFQSIGAFLKLLLIQCNNICTLHPIEADAHKDKNSILKDFKKIVDINYKTEHSTSFYADQLHITPDYLNRKIKENIGKTPKEYIIARIITEAKRLLYFTNLTNKEIAYELGFNEPANFSAFFKKHTNYSPSHFKNEELLS
ncbi:MAG: AraC family transcriptional regulator [Weeksellaceae bacterium]